MSSFNCSSCNAHNASNTRFCGSCGASLMLPSTATPYQTPSSQPEASLVAEFAFAGFWKRLVAHLLDSIIFGLLFAIVSMILGFSLFENSTENLESATATTGFYALLYIPAWWLYFALMESSSTQATLGKKIMGIRVTDLQGQSIGFGQATGRHFAGLISYMIFSIGYLMAAFTSRKQALHDMIAGTLVVNNLYGPTQINIASQNPGKGMSVGGIIAIVFLVLLIPVGGILAAIAIPAYQDYTIRAHVSQAIVETKPIQHAITQHAVETGYWPNTLQQTRIEQPINDENYQVQITTDGAYQIIFKRPEAITDHRLIFEPSLDKSGEYQWNCSSNDLKSSYLPPFCR